MRSTHRGRLAALLLLCVANASAHGVRTDIRVTLEAPAIPGLTVELHQGDIAPQIVLENRSGKLLEILDAEGRVFLRISPAQVEADVHSREWQASLNPAGTSRETASLTPKWRVIRKAPSYGWFDSRINTEPIQIPKPVTAVGRSAAFSSWRISARLDAQPFDIQGRFIYQPPPEGTVQAILRSSSELAPGIILQLAQGNPPALLIQNRSAKIVSVLDARGQAFLRVAGDGVHANTTSPAWRAASALPDHPQSRAGWQKVSAARNYSWLEPRLKYRGALPQDRSKPQELGVWRLPLQIGEQRIEIAGVYQWIPAPQR